MDKIYVGRRNRNAYIVYGPFESTKAAQIASMLSRPTDAYSRDVDYRVYANAGVVAYGDEELAYYVEHPEESGYSNFAHRPAKNLRPHDSWRKHGLAFARSYLERFTR